MSMKRALASGLIAASVLAFAPAPAEAQSRRAGQADRVRIAYVEPKNPEHRPLYERLKESRVLEHIRTLVSPVRLPGRLTLKIEGCDGVANAWYHEREVQVCYEYIADALNNAPQQALGEVTRQSVVMGAVVDVFLHELAHALFDMLEVPVFGREEDAADQVAAYLMLQLGAEDSRRLVAGVAYMQAIEAMKSGGGIKDFADEHGLPAQRFFNLLCMAYGANPKVYADLVEKGLLPKARAEGCEDEYAQVEHAFETLIAPHIDKRRSAQVRKEMRSAKWSAKWQELLAPAAGGAR